MQPLLSHLDNTAWTVLRTLARLEFATIAQVVGACGTVNPTTVRRRLRGLASAGLVAVERVVRPAIVSLTRRGARLLEVPPLRLRSWAVMRRCVQRNEAEQVLRPIVGPFCVQPRRTVWRWGLCPAVGEYGVVTEAGQRALLFVDGGMSPPARVQHAWTRPHRPPQRFWSGPLGQRWSTVVEQGWVVTGDAGHAARLRGRLAGLPLQVVVVPPLWNNTL